MDPFINPPTVVGNDIGDITLELGVGPHMIINTSAPQVANPSPSSPKVIKPKKSTEGDLNSDHAPINQYLQHPRPLNSKIDVGSILVVVVASMNHL